MKLFGQLIRVVVATLISFMSLALIAQTPAAAADGDLDTSFSGDGWVIQEAHASGEDGWEDVKFDANGYLVAGGWWNNNGQTNKHSWRMMRLTGAGTSTDATKFDNNSDTTKFWSPRKDHISEVLIQADGKHVAIGTAGTVTTGSGGDYQCTVTRHAANGNLGNRDTDFGSGGVVLPDFNNSKDDWCKGGALQSDGKIIIVGYLKHGSSRFDATIGRLNTDGSWDTSFSGDGKAIEHFDNDDVFQAVAIQADGKIVAVGTSQFNHTAGNILLARYNTDGSLDTSFGGGDGWQVTDFSNQDRGWDVKIQSNGKIVVAGLCDYANVSGDGRYGLVGRFNTDGSLDTSFSGDGKICQDHGGSTDTYQTLEIQSNGKIIAAGYTNNGGNGSDVAAARFTTAGALDTSFSGDGLFQLDTGNQHQEYIHGSSLTPDGQSILLVGQIVQASDGDALMVQIAASSSAASITMGANGAFRKDGNNTTIATHEDAGVTAVPGGYNNGDTMNADHEYEYDFDVNGTDRTFSLVLGAQPPSNVVFDFTIGAWVGDDDHSAVNTTLGTDLVIKDSGGNTVTQATFTNGNWNTTQTFTVVPVQDNLIEGYENGAIIATVNDAASDDMYGTMSVQKNVVIWDDDHNVSAGWDHINGAVDGLNLKAFPAEVVMTDYMEPGEQYIIDPKNGVGVRWYCIDPTALANHGGDIGNYIRSLGAAGVWASQVWVGSSNDDDGNTSFWRSQFGNKNWTALSDMDFAASGDAEQRYVWGSDGKLRWSDESEVPNGETGTACTGDDRLYFGFASRNEVDKNVGDETRASVLAIGSNDPQHTKGTPTIPEGSSTTFDVKLGAPPVNSETVSFSSPYAGASFSPSSITFTNNNYNTAQNVTLSIADNNLEEGTTFGSTVVWSVYRTTGTFAYNITDNDTAAITLSKTTTSVSEAGTTDSFTVVLTTDPATDVDISVVSADTGEATVSSGELAFTTNNWNTPQTVTVTGVNDGAVDGDITHNITLSVIDGQSDNTYDPVSDVVVQNTTADNDSAGFTVTQSGGSTGVAETGSTDTFTVSLTAQPATDVVLSVVSGDTGEATVDKAQLTFTNGNWNNAQTVTVTGINDDLDDGNISVTVTLAVVDADSHDSYDNVANQTVAAVNTDNDTAGFTITQSGGATSVTEGSDTDDFTLVLNAEPASDVVLSVVSSDTGEVTTGSATVTFTNANWSTAQTVTLTGVNDDVDDGNVNSTITIAVVDESSSNEFDNVANQTFAVANTDNDDAAFTVTPSATNVTEGATVTVSVRLQTAPTTNVMIDVTTSDASELSLSSVTITFTAGNWSTTQQITLTAVDDTDADGNTAVNLTTAINDPASDNTYDPLGNQVVEFTVADNDAVAIPADPDFDSDGIYNWDEKPGCSTLPDCDFDGLMDPDELAQCITNPDCDDDGVGDGAEIFACMLMSDCDGDGVNDVDERDKACIQDPKCTLSALDSDNDGINDKDELAQCVNNPDCDSDGIGDADELIACILMADCDGDGVGDASEPTGCIQNPICGKSRADTDRDGLTDAFEYSISKKCVTTSDCDNDGIPDGSEVVDCILKPDCDYDGVNDKDEENKTCVTDPLCTPPGFRTQTQSLGPVSDLSNRQP